jgi:hypothetical protein
VTPNEQAKRAKQVLSANSEAPLSVEELHNGVDFRSRIKRCAMPSTPHVIGHWHAVRPTQHTMQLCRPVTGVA